MQPGVNMLVHPRLQDAADAQDEWVLLAARVPTQNMSLVLLKNKANGEFTICLHFDGQLGFDENEDAVYVLPADRLNAALHQWNFSVSQYKVPESHRWSRLDNATLPPQFNANG